MIIWKSSSIMILSVILMFLMISRALHVVANSVSKISSLCFSVSFWLCHFSVFFCQIISASFLLLSRHESSDQSTRFSWKSSSDSKAFFWFWMRIWSEKSFTSEIEIFSKSSEESVSSISVSYQTRCCFRNCEFLTAVMTQSQSSSDCFSDWACQSLFLNKTDKMFCIECSFSTFNNLIT